MRILIADVNAEHASNVERCFLNAIAIAADAFFFGPGYSTEQELEAGVLEYALNVAKPDVVIITEELLMSSGRWGVRTAYARHRFLITDYSISKALRYSDSIINEVEQTDLLKGFVFFQDSAYLSDEWKEELQSIAEKFYIITIGKDFIKRIDNNTYFGSVKLNNNYLDFSTKCEKKIISINPIAISSNELFFAPLEEREYDWVVPGNIDFDYPNRRIVADLLKKSKYKLFNSFVNRTMQYRMYNDRIKDCEYENDNLKYIHSFIDSTYIYAKIPRESLAVWRENYNISLRKSRMAWADGGPTHTIVRKYAEIPARGTVLFCDYFYGFEAYGFIDGENCILSSPQDLLDKSEELYHNMSEMQKIARAGQQMISKNHTFEVRAKSTIKAFERILNGKYEGTYWNRGEMKFI